MGKSGTNPLMRNNPYSRIVFLFGPTGVGKTGLLEELNPGQFAVVNADSIQVYRGLDIGSAKAPVSLRRNLRHYLVDIEDPWNQFTVARFIDEADKAVLHIASEGKIPVLCGGTAYYFRHFLYGLSSAPASDPDVRLSVQKDVAEKGEEWAWEELGKVDPVSQGRIERADLYRITRALEVYRSSGRPLSSFALPTEPRHGMHPLILGLVRPRDEMETRIRCRVEKMFAEGLLEEIRGLVARGATEEWPGMQGIGYREFFQARESGEMSIPAIKDMIVRNSRLYAKRQMTFFRTFPDVTWVNLNQKDQMSRARSLLVTFAEEHTS